MKTLITESFLGCLHAGEEEVCIKGGGRGRSWGRRGGRVERGNSGGGVKGVDGEGQ